MEKVAAFAASKPIEIPYYPAFSVENRQDGVKVYWFEKSFSQVTYGDRPERGKNACVLIVLLTASKFAHHMKVSGQKRETNVNEMMIKCFAEGILQGIEEYSNLAEQNKLTSKNLTVPEGYKALRGLVGNIHEWVTSLGLNRIDSVR